MKRNIFVMLCTVILLLLKFKKKPIIDFTDSRSMFEYIKNKYNISLTTCFKRKLAACPMRTLYNVYIYLLVRNVAFFSMIVEMLYCQTVQCT